jgi:Zn-dependent protease with chaperone function
MNGRTGKLAEPLDAFVFPARPASVPHGLTQATKKYKRHATIAMLSLLGFVLVYIGLTAWFGWNAYAILANFGSSDQSLFVLIAGIGSALLALFMAKSLFTFQKGAASREMELKRKDYPRLFNFLHAIAKETGAPKPHRVFLSSQVNAAVFYDISFLSLFFSSKKNLEIGLGLVNILNMSEFKAVLAHEFGHFAQKSMAVGRWVYVAQQVATQIVAKRDLFDDFLNGLSRFDIRVAWIGWILQFVVWSIRSLTDTLLRGVILAQRALSREMEFQADLVSVSVTGSESLINALHKLAGADDALERAINFAASERKDRKPVRDVFAVQTRVLDHLRSIYNDPHYGTTPAPAKESPEQYRVFKSEVAAPPRMWATHPANADREENAKTVFVYCAQDERSAWELFPDASALREKMTAQLFAPPVPDKGHLAPPEPPPPPVPEEETFARLKDLYSIKTIDRRYRGAYLGQSATRNFRTVAEMYSNMPAGDITARLNALYPDDFGDSLEKLRKLFDEKITFEGLHKGYLKAPGGVVRWRGEEMAPRQLPKILKALDEEISPVKFDIANHLRETRSAHLAAARSLGQGWDAYLSGLASLLHYAEHTHADLMDLHGVLANIFAVVTADRRVDQNELRRLVSAGNDLYDALRKVFSQAGDVVLDERTAARAGIENFKKTLGEFRLPSADENNMSEWLNVIDSWVGSAAGALKVVHSSALLELLTAEDEIAAWHKAGSPAPTAPAPARAPSEYPRLMFGENRPRQEKLGWWDRFQIADGWFAASARTLVAASVVGAVIVLGGNLALHSAPRTEAFTPSAPSEQTDVIVTPYSPSSLDLAPAKPALDASLPDVPRAAPDAATLPLSAPAFTPSEPVPKPGEAADAGAQSTELAPSEAPVVSQTQTTPTGTRP